MRTHRAQPGGAVPRLRTLAYLNLGMNNAIIAAQAKGAKPQGAAAGAAAAVLSYLYPKDEQAIAARLAIETAALGANGGYRQDFTAGVAIGRVAGDEVVAMAKADRSGAPWTGTLPTGADKWSSRAQPPAPPLGPQLGSMRTFFMTTASEFRAPPPPRSARRSSRQPGGGAHDFRRSHLRAASHRPVLGEPVGCLHAGRCNDTACGISPSAGSARRNRRASLRSCRWPRGAQAVCHDAKYVYWVRDSSTRPRDRLRSAYESSSYQQPRVHFGAIGLVPTHNFRRARALL